MRRRSVPRASIPLVLVGMLGACTTEPVAPRSTGSRLAVADVWRTRSCATAMTDLGTLPGGTSSRAFGINGQGQIVGFSNTPSAPNGHAVLWTMSNDGYAATDLGTLPGGTFSRAVGINSRGQIVGFSNGASAPIVHAVLWTRSGAGYRITDLGTLPAGAFSYSETFGINGTGQIAGLSNGVSAPSGHATLWTTGRSGRTPHDLGSLPGGTFSLARSINGTGGIVGFSDGGSAPLPGGHAVLWFPSWTKSGAGYTAMDLGTLPGGTQSWALSINSVWQIVGYSNGASASSNHAVLWSLRGGGYSMTDLGTLPGGSSSQAIAINDQGDIAGTSYGASAASGHAVLWTMSGGGYTLQDLGTLTGGTQSGAVGINGQGAVVGFSDAPAAPKGHAVLWTTCGANEQYGNDWGDGQ